MCVKVCLHVRRILHYVPPQLRAPLFEVAHSYPRGLRTCAVRVCVCVCVCGCVGGGGVPYVEVNSGHVCWCGATGTISGWCKPRTRTNDNTHSHTHTHTHTRTHTLPHTPCPAHLQPLATREPPGKTRAHAGLAPAPPTSDLKQEAAASSSSSSSPSPPALPSLWTTGKGPPPPMGLTG